MSEELTIDQRLRFLVQSTESLHSSLQELHGIIAAQVELEAERNVQEQKRWGRLNNAIKAVVLEYFSENGTETE
jgi:hypothetical protein